MTRSAPLTHVLLLRRVGIVIGIVLLAGAIIVIWRQREVVVDALAAVARPAPLPLAMLLLAVGLNLVLSGVMFSLLMSRYGKVGRVEMQALIAATTLINYLPLRPGLLGRVAYHKAVNDIQVLDSARTVMQGVVLSVAVAGYLALVVLLVMRFELNLWLGVLAPAPALGLLSIVRALRIWCWAGLVRYGEVLVWAIRYFAAFSLLGLDIGWDSALAFACISVIATMVPFVSNGLGLREWAIGLTAPILTAHQLSLGLTAELVNRAAEVVVVLVAGMLGMSYLARRRAAVSNA